MQRLAAARPATRKRPALLQRFVRCRGGGFAVYGAIAALPLLAGVSVAIEFSNALRTKSHLQNLLDGAVLAGARVAGDEAGTAHEFFIATLPPGLAPPGADQAEHPNASFTLGDGVLDGSATMPFKGTFGQSLLNTSFTLSVESQARFVDPEGPAGPCITVLANAHQALLVNSGANVDAKDCEIHVHSTQNPAFIMNSGSKLDVARLCVKGTQYIWNGGTISKLETGCAVQPDPYWGKIPEPPVPPTCATSGAPGGNTHTLNPGRHCNVNFNGSPTITFKPGLHIIDGTMIINSGAKVIAEGVTFYFPNTNSELRANGNLTMTATAPTSGPYAGILMFERTSNAANNAQKRQYIFNGSNGEYLEGVIHLPNRDVTYNSKTNIGASRLSLVVNKMIINNADWKFEGISGGGGSSAERTVYLSR